MNQPNLPRALIAILIVLLPATLFAQPQSPAASFPVKIEIDASRPKGDLQPAWRFFGGDEPNYTYMNDGKKLIGQLAKVSHEPVYIRTHSLLSTGDGTPALKWGSTNAYTEDAQGNPIYNWTIVDKIFDTYLQAGCKPYVQIGFMPEAMSTHPEPYQHHWKPGDNMSRELFTGWAYPPKDYSKWGELAHQWVLHCVAKYGKDEVNSWYWEVWNEPNISYWHGTPQEYQKLYDYAADGVRRALPTARVGGSEVAGMGDAKSVAFQRAFFEHCLRGTNFATGQKGSPLDFVSFHAKGAPKDDHGHVIMGSAHQLHDIDTGFDLIASYPELKDKPIVIGESDPDGCAACPSTLYPANAYRNSTLYASYTAATLGREYDLADLHGVNFLGALTWAFEFEDQPYFAGYRVLATNGIELPVFNIFRMYSLMGGKRLTTQSSASVDLKQMIAKGVQEAADVSALASLDDHKLCVMVWHYHDNEIPGPDASVSLHLGSLPAGAQKLTLRHYRIDTQHSNSWEAWKKMGSPPKPTAEQYTQLEEAAKLQAMSPDQPVPTSDGNAAVAFDLPRQGISLLVFSW